MIQTILIKSAAAIACVLVVSAARAQEPPGRPAPEAREAEIDMRLQEMEHRRHELAVDEAAIELERIKHHISIAQRNGNADEVGMLELELKQATIRLEMRRVEAEMAGLRVEFAKERALHVGPIEGHEHPHTSGHTAEAMAAQLLAKAEMIGKLAEAELIELHGHAAEGHIPEYEAEAQEIRIKARTEFEQNVLRLEAESLPPAAAQS